jgi:hypothetical protein
VNRDFVNSHFNLATRKDKGDMVNCHASRPLSHLQQSVQIDREKGHEKKKCITATLN